MLFLLQHMVPLAVQVCLDVPVAAARMVLLPEKLVLLAESLVLRVARVEILEARVALLLLFYPLLRLPFLLLQLLWSGSIDGFGRCPRPPGEWSLASW